jgi:mutator protein MutT
LAIQERKAHPKLGPLWKLPGGLVETGETIDQAVMREVWEETGVKTKFVSIIGFRELLKYQWGQQDMYFVCYLEPEDSEEIDVQHTDEVSRCEWIDAVSFSIA